MSPSLSVTVTPNWRLITSFGFVPSAWSNVPTRSNVYWPLLLISSVNTVAPLAVPTYCVPTRATTIATPFDVRAPFNKDPPATNVFAPEASIVPPSSRPKSTASEPLSVSEPALSTTVSSTRSVAFSTLGASSRTVTRIEPVAVSPSASRAVIPKFKNNASFVLLVFEWSKWPSKLNVYWPFGWISNVNTVSPLAVPTYWPFTTDTVTGKPHDVSCPPVAPLKLNELAPVSKNVPGPSLPKSAVAVPDAFSTPLLSRSVSSVTRFCVCRFCGWSSLSPTLMRRTAVSVSPSASRIVYVNTSVTLPLLLPFGVYVYDPSAFTVSVPNWPAIGWPAVTVVLPNVTSRTATSESSAPASSLARTLPLADVWPDATFRTSSAATGPSSWTWTRIVVSTLSPSPSVTVTPKLRSIRSFGSVLSAWSSVPRRLNVYVPLGVISNVNTVWPFAVPTYWPFTSVTVTGLPSDVSWPPANEPPAVNVFTPDASIEPPASRPASPVIVFVSFAIPLLSRSVSSTQSAIGVVTEGPSSLTFTVITAALVSPSLSVIVTPNWRLITSSGFVVSAWSNWPKRSNVVVPSLLIVNVNTVAPLAVPTYWSPTSVTVTGTPFDVSWPPATEPPATNVFAPVASIVPPSSRPKSNVNVPESLSVPLSSRSVSSTLNVRFSTLGASSRTVTLIMPVAVSPLESRAVTPNWRLIASFGSVVSAWSSWPSRLNVYWPFGWISNVNTVWPSAVPTYWPFTSVTVTGKPHDVSCPPATSPPKLNVLASVASNVPGLFKPKSAVTTPESLSVPLLSRSVSSVRRPSVWIFCGTGSKPTSIDSWAVDVSPSASRIVYVNTSVTLPVLVPFGVYV